MDSDARIPDPTETTGTDLPTVLRRELGEVRTGVPLAPYCAYGVGGPAEYLVTADSDDALRRAIAVARRLGVPVTVLGQATNVVIADGGLPGIVILARNAGRHVGGEVLTCGSGAVLTDVVLELAERGLGGLEFAGNIPGSVGGAVVGNAGAYGRCIADVLLDADLVDAAGRCVTVGPDALGFGYRTSALKVARTPAPDRPDRTDPDARALQGAVVVAARFRLVPGARDALLAEIARDAELRRSKHPLEYASCGSYFKNPSPQRPAARYIEETGLKGLTVGRAQVSERHANFLVALDGATATDLLALAEEVKRRVREAHGVELEEEVVRLGVG